MEEGAYVTEDDKPIFLREGMPADENHVRRASKRMADLLASGGRIVIGTNEPVAEGTTVGRDGERHLVIKRRATRQEFVDTAPVVGPEDRALAEALHAPFYYELELWDRVIERPDGERLGIRLRDRRWTGEDA